MNPFTSCFFGAYKDSIFYLDNPSSLFIYSEVRLSLRYGDNVLDFYSQSDKVNDASN